MIVGSVLKAFPSSLKQSFFKSSLTNIFYPFSAGNVITVSAQILAGKSTSTCDVIENFPPIFFYIPTTLN